MDFEAARQYCKNNHDDLASIHNEEEQKKAQDACREKVGTIADANDPALVAEGAKPHGCWIGLGDQVRRTPCWPRSWASSGLLWLCSHRNPWANLHPLGQPNTFLAPVQGGPLGVVGRLNG